MKTRILSLALVLSSIVAVLVSAPLSGQQTLSQLRPGQRVRVVAPGPEGQPARYSTGNLLRRDADAVVLTNGGGLVRPETLTVALAPDSRLEVLTATRGHGWAGALIGSLAGGLAGAAIASAAWQPCTDSGFFACFLYPSQGLAAGGGGIIGGLAGALVGGLVGRSTRNETWVPVPLPPARVGLVPLRAGRLGLGASFSF